MTKKTSKKKQGNIFRQLLYVLIALVVALVALIFGVEPEEIENLFSQNNTDEVAVEVPPVSGNWYSVYFTQSINSNNESDHTGAAIENALIQQINNAQRTIDGALFELNVPGVTNALIQAVGRGVKVRLVLDDEHALEDPESTAEQVIAAGVEYRSDERSAFMHNKYLIIDSIYVWTGSTNITRNGFYNNNNNAILIRSQKLVENYQQDFEEMFTDGVFTSSRDTRGVPNRTFSIEGTQIETYFSPDDRDLLRQRIAELVNSAQSSIKIMTFSFTLDGVGQAIVNRINAGVTVEGVFETTGSLQGQMRPIACAGGNVRQDGNPKILHHKVIIIDDAIVLTGSFNISNNAIDNNSENMLIIHNPDIAAAYVNEFRARFNEGRVPSAADLAC